MNLIYSIENKDFKLMLLKEQDRKFVVKLRTNNEGEFNMCFKSIIDADNVFNQLAKDLYHD